ADDLGYGHLSCYGAKVIQTPHTDKLALRGLRFTNGHSSSATCTPSRYALMTGEYPWRNEGHNILPGDAALIVPVDKITLPKVFKQAGYQTGIVGKWHLGLGNKVEKNWNAEIRPGPNEVGFDYSFIFPATADRVPTVFMENGKVTGLANDDTIEVNYKTKVGNEPTGKENPDLLKLQASVGHNNTIVNGIGRIGYMKGGKNARWTDEEIASTFLAKAEQFIERNKTQPFFLFFSLNNIHVPRMPATMFKGKSVMGYRGDAILEMDWLVGEIIQKLETLGIAENTIIIFSSDNGPVLDDGYADEAKERVGNHRPAGMLRGRKTSIYEGGTRIPFIVCWPGTVKPGVSDAMINQMDMLSSFASLLKVNIPENEANDSENLVKALIGANKKGRNTMIKEGYNNLAIIKGSWKYIPAFKNKREQLFNLAQDISESTDLSGQYPEKTKELSQELQRIQASGR
ncbi:MAG TPA: arylsulfatase, partial [Niabella sp.]|nr:arylsulfatase [Niabella sp.]